ncbi:sensor histidine kinase [Microlunatus soli]|uniref:histidine kinase n=1 Tax=Microlunatus soli TaxID=630515 RepID=A0A1H1WGL8_9ACTN|nr:sensor histidine kinase [Microlunatus soli]SDS95319.1 Signal transduction histidine kinase [Microlunatus soli]
MKPLGRRSWLVDGAVACAVLVVAEIAIATGHETGAIQRSWLAYLLGVAMAAPVLLRRRHPLLEVYAVGVALLIFYSIGFPGFPPAVVLAVPLFDAARGGRPWHALPVPVLLMAAGMVVAIGNGMRPLVVVDQFLPQFGLVAVALLLGALIRSRQAYAEQTRQRVQAIAQAREREAERRMVEERLRIARELHDTVAHAITTITVQSGTALYLMDDHSEQAREALTAIRNTSKDVLGEMRTTLGALRGTADRAEEERRGLDHLPALLAAVRAAGLQVELRCVPAATGSAGNGEHDPPAVRVDHAAYRIVQESLTNVLRHAGPAARAEVCLQYGADAVTVEIRDDGVGPRRQRDAGHGLAGMAERVEALGGRFEAGAGPDGGYRVTAVLPAGPKSGTP